MGITDMNFNISDFEYEIWCDLEVVQLRILSNSEWDTKMVYPSARRDASKPVVNVYICEEDHPVFAEPASYREKVMRQGSYRGHTFGAPAGLKLIDAHNLAIAHTDPGKIIWAYVVKFVLSVFATENGLLHLKGAAVAHNDRAYLFLGRGGSGKTEVVRALCDSGDRLMGNTHLLVKGSQVNGIKSNLRVREGDRDIYLSLDKAGFPIHDGWLPIAAVFWLKYRTDGQMSVQELSTAQAKVNVHYFGEAVKNWELKEDIADYVGADPIAFADHVNLNDQQVEDFCQNHPVRYLNLDIFGRSGLTSLRSLMDSF